MSSEQAEDVEAKAFTELEDKYSEEWRNQAYNLVLDATGKYIERNNLRSSDFPNTASSAFYILALAVAKKKLAFKPDEGEKYLMGQLKRIRDGGYDVLIQIFQEIMNPHLLQ
ncbi:MAG: hypothetical protein ACE5J2_04055 [Nitrososphaerales archaeon]